MLQLRPGVRINGLKPEAFLGMCIVEQVYSHYGCTAQITSVVDGDHDGGIFSTSAHYAGMAFDVAKPVEPISEMVGVEMELQLRACLGEEFHVLSHKTKEHIHIAYLPKRP